MVACGGHTCPDRLDNPACPLIPQTLAAKQPTMRHPGTLPGGKRDGHWVAASPGPMPGHSPWHSVRAGLGWNPSSQSHRKLPAVLTQWPLAQRLGWARHSSSSETGGMRQTSGEALRACSPQFRCLSPHPHPLVPTSPSVVLPVPRGTPSPMQPSPEPSCGCMPRGQMQAKVPMRFLHSMP